MGNQLKVYVGYDTREDIAWQVCRNSLRRHASREVDVYPLKQATLRELGLYTREVDKAASTEFSLTRFLTPYLADSEGWSIFADCDFVFTVDIYSLLPLLDNSKAVYCVQHEYQPRLERKMDGKNQTLYPRKNWSSFIVFNGSNPHVRCLSPAKINSESPAYLHRFGWVPDDSLIGALPIGWNFLVGEYDKPAQLPYAIHFTNGGPWFENCRDVDYAELWTAEKGLLSQPADG